jgi:hypothetical protein
MDAEDLALGDDDLDVEVARHRPHAAVLELGAEPAQHVERGVHRPADVVGCRDVVLPVMAKDADPEAAQILTERLAIAGDRPAQAARVLRIVAGQGLEQQRAVLDGPGQRAAMIERVGVGNHARAAHQTERGHQADDTAQRCRAPDRSPRVGSQRRRDQARRDGRPRAGGGAAGEVGEVPGVARGGPRQIERRPGMGHLVGGQLAEQHGPRVVEPGGRRGVRIGDPVDEDARVRRGEDAARVVDVLERERDPVQRAAGRIRGDLGLGLAGLLPRQIERARDEGARLAVVLLDALDQGLDQIHGRQLPCRDQAGQLGDREVMKIGCHGVVHPRV